MPMLPYPPLEMRELVGPTDLAAFDNPSGALVYPDLPPESFDAVFDFGCGCGRVARQLMQQQPSPKRYVGVDLRLGMVRWCEHNLRPLAPQFQFLHHDVFSVNFNPGNKPTFAPFPVGDHDFTLVNAHSVFTHLTEEQAILYLRECARILRPDGILRSSWFLFDKSDFPMLQEFNNALYVSYVHPTDAVLFARSWVVSRARELGLILFAIAPPAVRGHQWVLLMTPARDGVGEVEFPEDLAPKGLVRSPLGPAEPAKVGLA